MTEDLPWTTWRKKSIYLTETSFHGSLCTQADPDVVIAWDKGAYLLFLTADRVHGGGVQGASARLYPQATYFFQLGLTSYQQCDQNMSHQGINPLIRSILSESSHFTGSHTNWQTPLNALWGYISFWSYKYKIHRTHSAIAMVRSGYGGTIQVRDSLAISVLDGAIDGVKFVVFSSAWTVFQTCRWLPSHSPAVSAPLLGWASSIYIPSICYHGDARGFLEESDPNILDPW